MNWSVCLSKRSEGSQINRRKRYFRDLHKFAMQPSNGLIFVEVLPCASILSTDNSEKFLAHILDRVFSLALRIFLFHA